MLDRVISGGQTGADQAGWRAAKLCGISTCGFIPLGFLTEDGPRPEFAGLYGAIELPTADYPARTRRNVFEASATIWFGSLDSPGAIATHRACMEWCRSILSVIVGETRPSDVVHWLDISGFKVMNVAGNRASTNPAIGERAERFLVAGFRRLAKG